MEQISETQAADLAMVYRLVALYSDLSPEDDEAQALINDLTVYLTAARIEGERQGLERAMKAVKMFWPDTEIIATIEALAKELPHDTHG